MSEQEQPKQAHKVGVIGMTKHPHVVGKQIFGVFKHTEQGPVRTFQDEDFFECVRECNREQMYFTVEVPRAIRRRIKERTGIEIRAKVMYAPAQVNEQPTNG